MRGEYRRLDSQKSEKSSVKEHIQSIRGIRKNIFPVRNKIGCHDNDLKPDTYSSIVYKDKYTLLIFSYWLLLR